MKTNHYTVNESFLRKEFKENSPENPPTAHSLFPTMATATLVLQVVIVGPGAHAFSKGSHTSVEHNECVPSDPPTNISFPEIENFG